MAHFSVELALPLSYFSVRQVELVFRIRASSGFLIESLTDRVEFELHLVQLRLQLRALLNQAVYVVSPWCESKISALVFPRSPGYIDRE